MNMSYYQVSDEDLRKSNHHRFRVSILISSISLEIFPDLINDLANLMSYMEGHMITPMLKKYRPCMRPYTQEIGSRNPQIRSHRRYIVQQWFRYVLWACWLKRVMSKNISWEFFEEEIEINFWKYEHALGKLRNPGKKSVFAAVFNKRGEGFYHLDSMVKPVVKSLHER